MLGMAGTVELAVHLRDCVDPALRIGQRLARFAIIQSARLHMDEGRHQRLAVQCPPLGPFQGLFDAFRSGEQGLAQLLLHLPGGHYGAAEQFAIWNVVYLVLLIVAGWLTWEASAATPSPRTPT